MVEWYGCTDYPHPGNVEWYRGRGSMEVLLRTMYVSQNLTVPEVATYNYVG